MHAMYIGVFISSILVVSYALGCPPWGSRCWALGKTRESRRPRREFSRPVGTQVDPTLQSFVTFILRIIETDGVPVRYNAENALR